MWASVFYKFVVMLKLFSPLVEVLKCVTSNNLSNNFIGNWWVLGLLRYPKFGNYKEPKILVFSTGLSLVYHMTYFENELGLCCIYIVQYIVCKPLVLPLFCI